MISKLYELYFLAKEKEDSEMAYSRPKNRGQNNAEEVDALSSGDDDTSFGYSK